MNVGGDTLGKQPDWPGAREGQALLWAAVMLPFFLGVIGLAIDGAAVFAARRSCQAVADGAARAGAMELDVGQYRESDGATVLLDPALAGQAAEDYLARRGWADAAVAAGRDGVTVVAGRTVSLGLMRLFGRESVRVTATGRAVPYHGIGTGQAP
jgi:Flp pilus assembly protein TadG